MSPTIAETMTSGWQKLYWEQAEAGDPNGPVGKAAAKAIRDRSELRRQACTTVPVPANKPR